MILRFNDIDENQHFIPFNRLISVKIKSPWISPETDEVYRYVNLEFDLTHDYMDRDRSYRISKKMQETIIEQLIEFTEDK